MGLVVRVNDALKVNPPGGDTFLSENGSNWLWTVTAIFVVSFIGIRVLSFKPHQNERIFHYIYMIALLVGSIAYFSMASDIGYIVLPQRNQTDRFVTRQIFFPKYIYWVVSFPSVILSLSLISGVSWATILFQIAAAWIWVVSYLVCAMTSTGYKWGFYVFGTVGMACMAVSMLTTGLTSSKRIGGAGGKHYLILAGWACFLWVQYPLVFGLTDGGNRLKVTSGFIWFGILDVLMVPVLSFGMVLLARKWDYGKMNLHFTQYGRVAKGEDRVEKDTAPVQTASA